jgi:hypothetical protein
MQQNALPVQQQGGNHTSFSFYFVSGIQRVSQNANPNPQAAHNFNDNNAFLPN